MQYDDLINMLRKNHPVSSKPQELTNKILQSTKPYKRTIHFNSRVIYRARIILTLAASFLIVYFIIEQHQINTKLRKLESSIVQVRYPELINNYSQVRYEQVSQNLFQPIPYDSAKQTLVINRRTLDFLMNRIRELESENSSIREKLEVFYNDSSTIHTLKQ